VNLDDLQAFVAVAEQGSFSRATEVLFITQPAVSKRIAALEQQLGTRLFDRIGHRVALTEAGEALLPRARDILMRVEDSRRAVRDLSGSVAGQLRIGTSHHIGLHRLPPVLRSFSRTYPDVELDIEFMDSEAACHAVEHGELELAIVTLPLEPAPALDLTPIWHDPLALVAGREHPLAQRRQVALDQLAAHRAVLPATGTFTRQILERALAPKGLRLQVGLSTNYLETIRMLVAVGLGWSVLPRTMLDSELVALPVSGLKLARELGVVRHRDRSRSNAVRALLGLLQSQKPKYKPTP